MRALVRSLILMSSESFLHGRVAVSVNTRPHAVRRGAVLHAIASGGIVAPALRRDVWPLLLGCLDPNETAQQQQAKRQIARQEYEQLRQICADTSGQAQDSWLAARAAPGVQALTWASLQKHLSVDIPRAGHDHPCLAGETREAGLQLLQAVLEALCLAEAAIGYWQGYTDLATPFLGVFDTEWEVRKHGMHWALPRVPATLLSMHYSQLNNNMCACTMYTLCLPAHVHALQVFWCVRQLVACRLRKTFDDGPAAAGSTGTRSGSGAMAAVDRELQLVASVLAAADHSLHR